MVLEVICPKCKGYIEGFVGDPRGAEEVECELCGAKFGIPEDARIEMN